MLKYLLYHISGLHLVLIHIILICCRRYFFLITFRSYLYCTTPREATFTSWMKARPELGHLCDNLKLDK